MMKRVYILCNHDLDNWLEKRVYTAEKVVEYIKGHQAQFEKYTIEMELPTIRNHEPVEIIHAESHQVTFYTDTPYYPKSFYRLVR